jgi:membrane protease YdiL (CAAX protease family)
VSKFSRQPIGLTLHWNQAALIILLGPILEEIVCRGYVLTFLLHLAKRTAWPFARLAAVMAAAVIFAAAHVANAGITCLQLGCIAAIRCLYGALRLNYRSAAAAVLTHSTYNLALCLSTRLGRPHGPICPEALSRKNISGLAYNSAHPTWRISVICVPLFWSTGYRFRAFLVCSARYLSAGGDSHALLQQADEYAVRCGSRLILPG